jgi:transmembrane sensor
VAPPEPAAPPPPEKPAATAESPETLLDRIAVLRSRGRYQEAAAALGTALRGNLAPATRERLSYELGSILTHQLGDPRRACDHWRDHARRFGAGRYDREVRQAMARLGCEAPP